MEARIVDGWPVVAAMVVETAVPCQRVAGVPADALRAFAPRFV